MCIRDRDKALQDLAKNEPPLYGLLRKERFIGAKGTVYQVLIPASKKEFSYVRLNQQARRDRIAKALSLSLIHIFACAALPSATVSMQ